MPIPTILPHSFGAATAQLLTNKQYEPKHVTNLEPSLAHLEGNLGQFELILDPSRSILGVVQKRVPWELGTIPWSGEK